MRWRGRARGCRWDQHLFVSSLFINEVIAYQGIPFEIRWRHAGERETLAAMAEAKQLAADSGAKR